MSENNTVMNDRASLAVECGRFLDSKKGRDVMVMDLKQVNSYLEYFVIATGNSHIHCKALARDIREFLLEKGFRERGRASLETDWIVLDFSDIIIHIFTQEQREYYSLEKLWADSIILLPAS